MQCSSVADGGDSSLAASADPLGMIVECSSNEECITGSVIIGPVTAGENYSCIVTAENSIGEDKMRTNHLIATTGEPVSVRIVLAKHAMFCFQVFLQYQ